MLVTLDVSQFSGWSNAIAPWNITDMLVTLDVSQSEISALKLLWPENNIAMLVTLETSQVLMGP